MVTNIPPGLQLTLIEHMAHLTSRDYAEVPRDLFLLGFVPKEQEKNIEDSGVVEVLADLYGKWTDGGGIKSVNANDVLVQMQDLAAEKGMLISMTCFGTVRNLSMLRISPFLAVSLQGTCSKSQAISHT